MKIASALLGTAASIALAASPALANPALASPTSATPSAVRYIGGCRAQGDYAICVASGNVNHPHSDAQLAHGGHLHIWLTARN